MIIEIGRKIKQLRLDAGMTQEQLGEKLGVSAQAVSKWEANLTTPDIQLLPELSVTFGVTIDELFSMTDESRMERIDNMLEDVRFLTDGEFADTERFLKEKMQADKTKARATLLLAQLYAKRGKEFNELAAPLARQALLLNPDEKAAHNAIFDAERGPYADWNVSNYWELIDFYKEFLKKHPENPRTYLWLLDLLIADGRTAEARHYLEAMDRVEHSFRTELYAGLIARAEGDVPRALSCWERMTGEFPEDWCAWSCRADCMAKLCRPAPSMWICRRPWPRSRRSRGTMRRPLPCAGRAWSSPAPTGTSPRESCWIATNGRSTACGTRCGHKKGLLHNCELSYTQAVPNASPTIGEVLSASEAEGCQAAKYPCNCKQGTAA